MSPISLTGMAIIAKTSSTAEITDKVCPQNRDRKQISVVTVYSQRPFFSLIDEHRVGGSPCQFLSFAPRIGDPD